MEKNKIKKIILLIVIATILSITLYYALQTDHQKILEPWGI